MEANSKSDLKEKILQLKKEKNAVLLAHYYQIPEIQEIADFVGDSLGLSQEAAKTEADIIIFAGVHFMAETAKILNPSKKVLLPDLKAGCSLAEACSVEDFEVVRKANPEHYSVTYINCSAAVKAYSDIICTSANALKIIQSIPENRPILFAPDKNLGAYLEKQTGRKMKLWDGECIAHVNLSIDKINALKTIYPEAKLLAHPESEAHILEIADYIGSTTGIIQYAKTNHCTQFIIATEAGILHQLKQDLPNKKFIPAPAVENNTCACSECHYMKMNTLEKIYACLVNESPAIELSEEIRLKALKPLLKMLDVK
jgi:quinolinate synthase